MPPDRTTSSFLESINSGAPLSSKGAQHPPSLERGKACLVCRTRKVKCDGQRPTCGSCSKSAVAHGEDPIGIICNYDEPERGEKRKRGAGGVTKIQSLEAKIAELEKIIADSKAADNSAYQPSQAQQQQQGPSAPFGAPQQQPIAQFGHSAQMQQPVVPGQAPISLGHDGTRHNHFDILLQASGQHSHQPGFPSHVQAEPTFFYPENNSLSNFPPTNPTFYNNDPIALQGVNLPEDPTDAAILLEILYPGWPRDLPTPTLVTRLIDVYFTKNHFASGMINVRKFLAAMQLPPTHSGFPHQSLIHAMLASAARLVSSDFFTHEEKYWGRTDPGESVSDYHAKRSKAAIDEAIASGQKLFQVAQATVLLCFYAYTSARFVEVWLGCGLATRVATPLGLNHLRTASAEAEVDRKPLHAKPNLLTPTDDPEELYERSVTFYLGFVADRFASASTGWAMSLDETDITTLLPSPSHTYPDTDLAASPLSPRNPNFLISHPPHLVEGFQLFIKAVVLLGRVVTFLQRSPTTTRWQVGASEDREAPVDLRTTREFKQLDADAVTFRLSIPRDYQNIQQHATEDSRLCLVFAVPHTTTIILHEPFCTMQEGDVSMARCLLSARAILEAIYSLWSTSFEIALLSPFINYCWAVAGRTLVRELAIKQAKGIVVGTDQLRADINTILAAMRAYKSPLGTATANSLQSLFDDPSLCLPHKDLRCTPYAAAEGPCAVAYPQQRPGAPPSTVSSGASPVSFDMPTTPSGLPPQMAHMASNGDPSSMLFGGNGFPGDDGRFKEMTGIDFGDLESVGNFAAPNWIHRQ